MGCWQFDANREDLGIMFKLNDAISFYYGNSQMVMDSFSFVSSVLVYVHRGF